MGIVWAEFGTSSQHSIVMVATITLSEEVSQNTLLYLSDIFYTKHIILLRICGLWKAKVV